MPTTWNAPEPLDFGELLLEIQRLDFELQIPGLTLDRGFFIATKIQRYVKEAFAIMPADGRSRERFLSIVSVVRITSQIRIERMIDVLERYAETNARLMESITKELQKYEPPRERDAL